MRAHKLLLCARALQDMGFGAKEAEAASRATGASAAAAVALLTGPGLAAAGAPKPVDVTRWPGRGGAGRSGAGAVLKSVMIVLVPAGWLGSCVAGCGPAAATESYFLPDLLWPGSQKAGAGQGQRPAG